MTWEMKLPYERPPMSLNKHVHHMKEYRLREQIKTDIGWLARYHKLPKGLQQIKVELLWVVAPNRRRDTDNPTPSLKPMIDALVKHGVVPDDTAAHVRSEVLIEAPTPYRSHGMYLVVRDIAPR